jgi:selenide,water dikinase
VLRHIPTGSTDPALLVGLDDPDDAAVYRLSDEIALVQTVDFFTPIVDDAYSWGWIAAANALSDVYAMGARPVTALNLVAWPRSLGFELLGRVLAGGSAACAEAGVALVGGHSVDDPEPKYGLAVTGTVHPDRIVRNTGALEGSDLVLTKPLGTGIVSTAIKQEKASGAAIEEAVNVMSRLNADASAVMVEVGPEAATDVTGFGLVGHLLEMLGGAASARLDFETIPVLTDALELAEAGFVPGGTKRNHESMREAVEAGGLSAAQEILVFDAQTSGGLLIAVDPRKTSRLLDALAGKDVDARRIGSIVEGDGRIEIA